MAGYRIEDYERHPGDIDATRPIVKLICSERGSYAWNILAYAPTDDADEITDALTPEPGVPLDPTTRGFEPIPQSALSPDHIEILTAEVPWGSFHALRWRWVRSAITHPGGRRPGPTPIEVEALRAILIEVAGELRSEAPNSPLTRTRLVRETRKRRSIRATDGVMRPLGDEVIASLRSGGATASTLTYDDWDRSLCEAARADGITAEVVTSLPSTEAGQRAAVWVQDFLDANPHPTGETNRPYLLTRLSVMLTEEG